MIGGLLDYALLKGVRLNKVYVRVKGVTNFARRKSGGLRTLDILWISR